VAAQAGSVNGQLLAQFDGCGLVAQACDKNFHAVISGVGRKPGAWQSVQRTACCSFLAAASPTAGWPFLFTLLI
jgi:hypothetical protein